MARKNQAEQPAEQSHKDYVELFSEVTVRIEPSPSCFDDETKRDSDIPNRMKIIEKHSKYGILIKQGTYKYPGIILEWPVVKAMIANHKFAVKSESDDAGQDEELVRQKELLDESKAPKSEETQGDLAELAKGE